MSFLILDLRDLACKRGSLDTMSDGVPSTGLLASHKARQPRRSSPLTKSGVGRGSDTHVRSKNKTWVSDSRKSASPAPEGRWERGRGFGGGRGRGRGAAHGVNGHLTSASASTLRSRLSLRALGTGMKLVSRPLARRACGGIRVRRRACRRGTRCLAAMRILLDLHLNGCG